MNHRMTLVTEKLIFLSLSLSTLIFSPRLCLCGLSIDRAQPEEYPIPKSETGSKHLYSRGARDKYEVWKIIMQFLYNGYGRMYVGKNIL